jgi:hypothetical protein
MHRPKCILRVGVSLLFCCLLLLVLERNRNDIHATDSVTADVTTDASAALGSKLRGKLYLRNGRLRIDWGEFADVFDLNKRTGWRILPYFKAYKELGDKDMSTYAPKLMNGSLCPYAQVPSACKLVGKEKVNGRITKKWDLWNPKGFHVYVWMDDTLPVSIRCDIGETRYEVKNLRKLAFSDGLFEIPAGYQRVDQSHL